MTDSQLGQGMGRKRAQRGVSLLEVLVVLVILVVGILVIIRLYPSGFFSIQSTGNSALADGLGSAAIGAQNQDTSGIAEAVLPGPLDLETNAAYASVISQYSDYDPDDPNTLDNARRVSNETITVPARTGGSFPVYVVNYGPIALPSTVGLGSANLTNYLAVNSLYWQPLAGDSTQAGLTLPILPQDTLGKAGIQRCLVDYTTGKIAVPTAPYPQAFVLKVVAHDPVSNTDKLYTLDFTVTPSGTSPAMTEPVDLATRVPYPDVQDHYNGGWFDPVGTNSYVDTSGTTVTYKYNTDTAPAVPPSPWKAVFLYRPFQPVATTTILKADPDPYEYMLTAPSLGNTNPGAIAFNPRASGGNGAAALKARISYQTYSWKILHEDHDIPALTGGSTAIIRTTVQNLRQAGAELPDGSNTIYPGIAGSGKSLLILDLDTGLPVGLGTVADPTNTDAPVNDEDTNGTIAGSDTINASYSTGRFTFGSNAFGDNPNGATSKAHRVRIFYESSLDWTVAVQKAPSYYTLSPSSANAAAGTDPALRPAEYAYDAVQKLIYLPHKDAGNTVELDGTYTDSSAQMQSFRTTVPISPVVTTLGTTRYVTTALTLPTGATNINLSAVRGLSTRAVVAWKERDRWKVHTVDTLLNRTP